MATTQHAVVAGLGKTGQSVIRHLLARGWQVAGTDSRSDPPGLAGLRQLAPGMQLALGGLDQALLDGADCVIASPGLSQADPFFVAARQLGVEISATSSCSRAVALRRWWASRAPMARAR